MAFRTHLKETISKNSIASYDQINNLLNMKSFTRRMYQILISKLNILIHLDWKTTDSQFIINDSLSFLIQNPLPSKTAKFCIVIPFEKFTNFINMNFSFHDSYIYLYASKLVPRYTTTPPSFDFSSPSVDRRTK